VVLNAMRLLSSRDYDSRTLLYVILAGDARLRDKLKSETLLPHKSRIRTQVELEHASPSELTEVLRHLVAATGNAQLMTSAVVTALAEHAAGNTARSPAWRTSSCRPPRRTRAPRSASAAPPGAIELDFESHDGRDDDVDLEGFQ